MRERGIIRFKLLLVIYSARQIFLSIYDKSQSLLKNAFILTPVTTTKANSPEREHRQEAPSEGPRARPAHNSPAPTPHLLAKLRERLQRSEPATHGQLLPLLASYKETGPRVNKGKAKDSCGLHQATPGLYLLQPLRNREGP
ncbi:hypothetical protein FGO68_gene3636 [Halteria grandinella]|uniref:Uncharacterized protein n=1 Tax=Halteria grandinella TaxID=5974 RepID=A0A8J8NW27_HALGN|nr:hypothetical protein FGO68_gene3636 [Halteria grandinella]